jgi:hypothetical protein
VNENMNARALKILAATKLLPLLLLLALPAVAQAQPPFITQDAIPITGYTSLAYGDAVTIPSTANGHRVTSIEFQGFDNGLHDLLHRYRIRTRSWFKRNFQNDFAVACNCPIPVNASGIVATKHEAAPPVMFLSAAITRGPPWSGDQSLYLFDNALDRPAQHFCSAPASLRVPFSRFIVSPQRDLPAHPIIHGKQSLGLACCSHFPVKYNPTVHLKELL